MKIMLSRSTRQKHSWKQGAGKNVALVGHLPFIPLLRKSVGNLWVIEQNPSGDDCPAQSAADLIPKADVMALTGSAVINHTLEELLGESARRKIADALTHGKTLKIDGGHNSSELVCGQHFCQRRILP